MFLLLTYQSKKVITIPTDNQIYNQKLLEKAQIYFKNSKVSNLKKTENSISFRGAIFRFAWNGWNFLNGIWKSRINTQIQENQIVIDYKVWFTEYFIIALIFSLLPVFISYKPLWALWLTFLIWGVFYLGACLVSIVRFNSFIKKISK